MLSNTVGADGVGSSASGFLRCLGSSLLGRDASRRPTWALGGSHGEMEIERPVNCEDKLNKPKAVEISFRRASF